MHCAPSNKLISMKIDLARSPREIQVVANRATSNKVIIRSGIGMSAGYLHDSNLEHNITNIILVDASESLNGSRVEAYARGDIRRDVICLIFALYLPSFCARHLLQFGDDKRNIYSHIFLFRPGLQFFHTAYNLRSGL